MIRGIVQVRLLDDRRLQGARALHRGGEVIDEEPQRGSDAVRLRRIAEARMLVVPLVELD